MYSYILLRKTSLFTFKTKKTKLVVFFSFVKFLSIAAKLKKHHLYSFSEQKKTSKPIRNSPGCIKLVGHNLMKRLRRSQSLNKYSWSECAGKMKMNHSRTNLKTEKEIETNHLLHYTLTFHVIEMKI